MTRTSGGKKPETRQAGKVTIRIRVRIIIIFSQKRLPLVAVLPPGREEFLLHDGQLRKQINNFHRRQCSYLRHFTDVAIIVIMMQVLCVSV